MGIDALAVIGAGTMGRGIAQTFAVQGYPVALVDVEQHVVDQAYDAIGESLERAVGREDMSQMMRKQALERISRSAELDRAVADVDLVIEAVPEQEETKRRVMEALDEKTRSDAVLASNTSSISLTWLGGLTSRPERVIGMHFFNPVPRMSLVEVVRGRHTSDEVVSTVSELAEDLGKVAVEVEDSPGFVSNRILMPMINEAVYCVMEGVAAPEDVDRVMKLGMAHPMGPLELADFIGLDVCLSILEVLHEEIGEDKYRPCPLLRRMVAAGDLGRKSGEGFFNYP